MSPLRASAALALALCGVSEGRAQPSSLYPSTPDLSGYVTTDALNAAMSAATSNSSTKLDAVPASGPGAGKCRFSVVASSLIQSGGVTGTPGTCSRIVQCGTSGAYVVAQFNIGDGC